MAGGYGLGMTGSVSGYITVGTEKQRGFVNGNIYHSPEAGDICYSSYIPEGGDRGGSALYVTLPGWEGLEFQGIGANMVEDFGVEAIGYDDRMIVISPQLSDWGERSADQVIALTEYLTGYYDIDPDRVYLQGYSAGGETGSLVMEKRPDLYTAFLCCSASWDGDFTRLVKARTPVYMVIGEEDSYYGSGPLVNAYEELYEEYVSAGLDEEEIDRILVLDIKDGKYFTDRGYTDQHMGGQAFAHDPEIMGRLFGR